jgi:hypothetical protein
MTNNGATFYILTRDALTGGYYTLSGTTLTRGGNISAFTGAHATANEGRVSNLATNGSVLMFCSNGVTNKDEKASFLSMKIYSAAFAGGACTEKDVGNNLAVLPIAVLPYGSSTSDYLVIDMQVTSSTATPVATEVWNYLNIYRINKTAIGF